MLGAVACSLTALLHVSPAGAQPAPDLLERGRYLGEVVAFCGACHHTFGPGMQPIAGMSLAGGRVFEERGMRAVAPNITQDRETGIGGWTDGQIADAIRNGHRPDGSLSVRPCRSRATAASRIATSRLSLHGSEPCPSVRHAVTERSRYSFALTPAGPPVTSVPDPPADDPVARGRYIAVNLAHCMDCHSAQFSEGRADPNGRGARGLVLEGPWGAVQAANISSHPSEGIGRWSDEQVLGAITRGVSADGRRLAPPMAGRAPVWARMAPEDLRAVVAYLRSLPPQER
jgi:mono/diheme cytochrome c family protein